MMAKPTSPLSQKIKQKQMLILGGVGLGIMLLAIGSAYVVGGKKPLDQKAVVTVTRNLLDSTTDTADREKWRERSAQDIERLRQQMSEQQKANAELQSKMGKLLENGIKAGEENDIVAPPGSGQIVPPPVGFLPAKKEGALLPGSPVPMAAGGQEGNRTPVLGGPGMVMPDGTTVNAPASSTPSIQSIKFDQPAASSQSQTTNGANAQNKSNGRTYRTGPNGERIYLESSDNAAGDLDKTYVPPGAFARVVILGGVDAPTGGQVQSNPIPVLLRVLGDAQLPGRARTKMKDCVLTADAIGDLSSERVQIRLQKMSCRVGENKMADITVKGHVNGEDGKAGIRGRLVTKTGQILGTALLTGTLSALGSAVANSTTQYVNTGLGTVEQPGGSSAEDMAKYALGNGVSEAFDRLSDYYIKLAEKVFPVLEIDSMRVVDIVFTQGFSIEAK